MGFLLNPFIFGVLTDTSTKLLLHAEDFTDSSPNGISVTNQSLTITTGYFGNAFQSSLNNTYCSVPTGDGYSYFSGNFTVECWFKVDSLSTTRSPTLFSSQSGWAAFSELNYSIFVGNTGKMYVRFGVGNSYTDCTSATGAISSGTWYHMAAVRNGSAVTLYIGGKSAGTATVTSMNTNSTPLRICGEGYDTSAAVVHMDEIRISNIARWTANFTPPTAPY